MKAQSQGLVDKAAAIIRKYSMLSGGESVLAGLSGGPDSVCLIHVLDMLRDRLRLQLTAIYIDHGLRPHETPAEIDFCRKLCDNLHIPFLSKAIDVKAYALAEKLNMQEAARLMRYQSFDMTVHELQANKIALAHTADDQAETLLMRLLRGSGATGLAGIPPVRRNIIRPLIEIERREIESFLDEHGFDCILDSSNLKRDYVRNNIRLSLIPHLKEFNPDLIGTLSRTAELFRDDERYFGIIVTKTLMKLISRKTDTRIELFLSPFGGMDKVIMRRILRRAIDETKGLRGISFVHIEDIIGLIKDGDPGDRVYLPKGIRAIKDYSTIVLTSEAPVTLVACQIEIPGDTILKEAGIVLKASLITREEAEACNKFGLWISFALFDADCLSLPLFARPRRDGDFFYPSGFGRRKKIQDFLVDLKVPRDERNRVPMLVSGEDIIWVVEHRGDNRFIVHEGTKSVLKIEVKKMKD
ncbi:MAG TPA: tRNA lysidine(34) synthetase TilS [Thermodesulfovibrionales bacterium]|nr:tRNA lysidine(34) synthetase TilS [Thermodesulfovibrionales bacterium]